MYIYYIFIIYFLLTSEIYFISLNGSGFYNGGRIKIVAKQFALK